MLGFVAVCRLARVKSDEAAEARPARAQTKKVDRIGKGRGLNECGVDKKRRKVYERERRTRKSRRVNLWIVRWRRSKQREL